MVDALDDLSHQLWTLRELLDQLVYKLEVQQLLLGAGRSRWLPYVGAELDAPTRPHPHGLDGGHQPLLPGDGSTDSVGAGPSVNVGSGPGENVGTGVGSAVSPASCCTWLRAAARESAWMDPATRSRR